MRFSILVAHQFVFNGVENTEYDALQAQEYADPRNVHSIIQKSFVNSLILPSRLVVKMFEVYDGVSFKEEKYQGVN